jgi:hypothetical protein
MNTTTEGTMTTKIENDACCERCDATGLTPSGCGDDECACHGEPQP